MNCKSSSKYHAWCWNMSHWQLVDLYAYIKHCGWSSNWLHNTFGMPTSHDKTKNDWAVANEFTIWSPSTRGFIKMVIFGHNGAKKHPVEIENLYPAQHRKRIFLTISMTQNQWNYIIQHWKLDLELSQFIVGKLTHAFVVIKTECPDALPLSHLTPAITFGVSAATPAATLGHTCAVPLDPRDLAWKKMRKLYQDFIHLHVLKLDRYCILFVYILVRLHWKTGVLNLLNHERVLGCKYSDVAI